jgi:hypothetical protein
MEPELLNIGKGPIRVSDMDPMNMRDYLAVAIDPGLKTCTIKTAGLHIEAMSDDLDRLKAWVAKHGVEGFPDAVVVYYKKAE